MATFNVYRREVGDTNPSALITSGLTTTEYVDTTAEKGKQYLYSVGAVVNSVEKLSDELIVSAGQTYRYIRIYVTDLVGGLAGNQMELYEIELLNEHGLDVTAPATPVFVSSSQPRYGSPQGLIDNNPGSYYLSAVTGQPHWFYFDLVSPSMTLSALTIRAINNNAFIHRCPKNFTVQGSNDASNWVDIKSFSNVTNWQANVVKTFDLKTGAIT